MSRPASCPASIVSISGAIEVNVRPPPSHFSNRTFVSATDVMEEVSSATVRTWSIGTLLTSRIERTARREAIATSGSICSPGNFCIRRRGNDADVGGPVCQRAGAG